ncbi:MAG TPA: ankyrin repeat domain-containing protein, partial [Polyangiaceae bacterium]
AADLDTVRALCARHARLAAQRDSKGSWPLVEACDRGALEIARALLDAGADAKQGDPLLAAAHAGPHKKGPALAVVALLLDRGAPNDLFTHALLGRVDELKRDLLGADVNALGPADSSALFLAAWNGQREAVQVLLDAGAEPNPVGRNGQSTWQCLMLHIWSERHREIARLLLARGVPCTFQEACILSHTPTIERMLAVDPGLKDRANDAGVTPLGIAVLNADVELARILLAAGAADPKGRAHALVHGVRCSDEDLSERVYRNCALKRTNFHDCNLEDSTFSNVNLAGVRIDNVNLSGASIDNAFITGLTIYGIDVEPLLRRELTRRAARKRETS